MKKPIWIVGGVLVLLLVLRIGVGISSRPSEKDQIRQALADSIQASREGRPGGVMEMLSSHLTFNDQEASSQFGQLAKFIKEQKPDISVDNQEPIVTGDEARITSPVEVKLSFFGQQRSVHLKSVVLIFHREPSTEWLVIPSTKWKLQEVRAQNVSAEDFAQ